MKTRKHVCSIKTTALLAVIALFILSGSSLKAQTWAGAVTGTTVDTAHAWNQNGNWTSPANFPNSLVRCSLTGDFTAATTINLNQAITVGSLTLQDTVTSFNAITLAPNGGSLTFDVSSGSAALNALTTSSAVANVISSGIQLNDPLDITVRPAV